MSTDKIDARIKQSLDLNKRWDEAYETKVKAQRQAEAANAAYRAAMRVDEAMEDYHKAMKGVIVNEFSSHLNQRDEARKLAKDANLELDRANKQFEAAKELLAWNW